jgi:HEPN domain-containing protein
MNRADFQKLTRLRLKEAKHLLNNKCYEGAYYLAGYAVECALKTCIAKKTKRFDFPPKPEAASDLYTHQLPRLVKAAGLQLDLESKMRLVAEFNLYWATVKDWSEESRYEAKIDKKRASDLYLAITDEPHGVLSWLKKY